MTVTRRAHAILTVKAVNDEERTIEGVASTPSPDRVGDIVEPLGAKFTLPMPLLWQHDSGQPIGHVVAAKPTKNGIPIKATLAKIDEPGPLKDSIDHAWQAIKAGLVRGLSIGFRVIEHSIMENGGWRITDWDWLELSAVTIPANADATILNIKKFDTSAPAVSGIPVRSANTTSPVSGTSINLKSRPKEGQRVMNNVGAQIAALEEQRKEKATALEAIQEKATAEGRTKSAEERQGFDELRDELKQIDAEIADLKDIEELYAKPTVKVVDKAADPSPKAYPSVRKEKDEPGVPMARLAKVRAVSRLDIEPMGDVAEKMYGRDSEVYHTIKTSVQPGTTVSGNWGANLVGAETDAVADFVGFLRKRTIVGQFGTNGIPSLRRVAFRRPLVGQTGGGSAGGWVGQAKPKPLTAFNFARDTLEPMKVAKIAVLSEENVRDSSPSSDIIVRDALVDNLVETLDLSFVSPANDGESNVEPASITNGAPSIVAQEWTDADDVRLDIRALMKKFTDANNRFSSGVFIMSETNAAALWMLTSALGVSEFPSMEQNRLMRLPVIVSDHVGDNVILVNASDIYLGDDGGFAVDMSREASLEMDDGDNFTQNPPTGASLVSLWQNNLVGIKAERTIAWKRRRDSAVAYLTGVEWGGEVPAS